MNWPDGAGLFFRAGMKRLLAGAHVCASFDDRERGRRSFAAIIDFWSKRARLAAMRKIIDRLFAALLLVGGVLHAFGSIYGYRLGSEVLVWALSGSLAAILLAVLNLVRAGRPEDRTLAWITFCGCLCWAAVAIAFGAAIGNVADPRVLWHAISALALAAFSLRTAIGRASA
jgi:hypothetical protein